MFVLPQTRTVRQVHGTHRRVELAPSLAQVIDHLLDGAARSASVEQVRSPALDVDETDREYLLRLDMPGVAREQLKVTIEGRRVSVETMDATAAQTGKEQSTDGTAAASEAPQATSVVSGDAPRSLYRERSAPRYARTVSLPKEVSSEDAEAKLVDGVLSLRLPKRVADGARRLTIG